MALAWQSKRPRRHRPVFKSAMSSLFMRRTAIMIRLVLVASRSCIISSIAFDHADGNAWLNSVGAKISAHGNTHKHLSEVQRVEDRDSNSLPLQTGGLPGDVFSSKHKLKLNGSSISLKYYRPARTDGDISVTFGEADLRRHSRRRHMGRLSTRMRTGNSRRTACKFLALARLDSGSFRMREGD